MLKISGTVFCVVAFCLSPVTDAAPPSRSSDAKASAEFQRLQELSAAPIQSNTSDSAGVRDALNQRHNEIRARGLKFIRAHPDDPRRWLVVWMLRVSVHPPSPGGDPLGSPAWRAEYQAMLETLIAAPDAAPELKPEALSYLFESTAASWRRRQSDDNARDLLPKLRSWFDLAIHQYPTSFAPFTGLQTMANVLEDTNPEECHAFLTRLIADHATDRRPDPQIRKQAERRLKRLSRDAQPLLAYIRSVEGGDPNDGRYRGKIVVLATHLIAWEAGNDRMRQLYARYRNAGVVFVHITADWTMKASPARYTTREMAALMRQHPWYAVYDRDDGFRAVAKDIGYFDPSPLLYVIDRDSRIIVCEFSSAKADLESAIDRELAAMAATAMNAGVAKP